MVVIDSPDNGCRLIHGVVIGTGRVMNDNMAGVIVLGIPVKIGLVCAPSSPTCYGNGKPIRLSGLGECAAQLRTAATDCDSTTDSWINSLS